MPTPAGGWPHDDRVSRRRAVRPAFARAPMACRKGLAPGITMREIGGSTGARLRTFGRESRCCSLGGRLGGETTVLGVSTGGAVGLSMHPGTQCDVFGERARHRPEYLWAIVTGEKGYIA